MGVVESGEVVEEMKRCPAAGKGGELVGIRGGGKERPTHLSGWSTRFLDVEGELAMDKPPLSLPPLTRLGPHR